MTLAELEQNWTAGWNYLWQEAQRLYADRVRADPKAYQAQVAAFIGELTTTRQALDRLKAGLGPRGNRPDEVAQFNRLAREHYELSTRFYADTRPADRTQLGFVAVLIVLGLAVGVSATAWAAASWQYAVNLREQTALAARELEARIAASREGRTLQPSTLPAPPAPAPPAPPADPLKGIGKWVFGGLLVAIGVLWVPPLLNRK